jgi:hypothetical protein
LCRLAFVLALTLTYAAAQSVSPSGSYGFVASVSAIDSAGANGGALLGVMNFDGVGNVTGNAVIKPRSAESDQAQAVSSPFTGTWSANPDGTGSLALTFDVGITAKFAIVSSDNGQGLQFISTDCSPCGVDFNLLASTTGVPLPISLFYKGASGFIPVTFSTATRGGATVYTANAASGNGTTHCPDGSNGTWTASVPGFMIVVTGGVGNFFASVSGTICGESDFETTSGLVTPGTGNNLLVLHGTGYTTSGIARAATGAPNGSYAVQLNGMPFPGGIIGLMKFDGAGNVTAALTSVGGTINGSSTGTPTGTYSLNSDGSGTISLTNGPSFAFVTTDGGSQLLLLRTNGTTNLA